MNVSRSRTAIPKLPPDRITVLAVDGNSVAALAALREENGILIEALEHLELDRLVEVEKRLRHPIFMDVNFCFFPERDVLTARFRDFLGQRALQNPTLALLAPEKLHPLEVSGEASEAAALQRRQKLLRAHLPMNPYDYPCVIAVQEIPGPGTRSTTRIVRARLADVLPLSQIVRELAPAYLGLFSGLSASAAILNALQPLQPGMPITLCDVGKLRTLYSTSLPSGEVIHHPIPVGLARDDQHYFKSISPSMDSITQLEAKVGRLLLSPEVTPSPLFNTFNSSPQIDATRLAVQISRFTSRCFEADLRNHKQNGHYHTSLYLTGRGSRLPGLRRFVESRLMMDARRIDRRPVPHIRLAPNLKWGDVADNLLLVGAALDFHHPRPASIAPLTTQLLSPPMESGRCSAAKLEAGALYVLEHRPED